MPGEQMTLRRESAVPASAPYVGVDQLLYNEADGGLYVKLPDGQVRRVNVPPSDARVSAGDARGADAVDFQYTRVVPEQVASGARSAIVGGASNATNGVESMVAAGLRNLALGAQALAGGKESMAGGKQSLAFGQRAIAGELYQFGDYTISTRTFTNLVETYNPGDAPIRDSWQIGGVSPGMVVFVFTDGDFLPAVVESIDNGAKTITLVASPAGLPNVVADIVYVAWPGSGSGYGQGVFGEFNVVPGLAAFVGGGNGVRAEGTFSGALAAEYCRIQGRSAAVVGGAFVDVPANYAFATGRYGKVSGQSGMKQGERGEVETNNGLAMGYYPHSRLWGQRAFTSGVINQVLGRGQHTELEMVLQTADATPTVVQIAENQGGFTFEDDKVYWVEGYALAVNLGAAEYASYTFKGLIHRGAGAASVTLVSAGVVQTEHETVAGWDFAMAADPAGGGVKFTCTGEAAKNIDWLVHVEAGELASA